MREQWHARVCVQTYRSERLEICYAAAGTIVVLDWMRSSVAR